MTRTTEAFQLLRAVNPVPGRPPAKRPWRRAGLALVLAALVLCFLLVAPAVGIRVPALDFWTAEKAPPKVVQDFETLSEGAPAGMDPGAIPGETRKVTLADGQTLWVAPTRYGGFCTLGRPSGGCDKLGTFPLSVTWSAARVSPEELTRRPMPMAIFDRISGHVKSKYVDAVEVRFADGDTYRLQLAWVSEPIEAGFFEYVIPAARRRAGHEIKSVVALDADGRVVTQEAGDARLAAPLPDAVVDEKKAAVRLATSRGEAVVWEAPTRYEGRCAWLEYLGRSIGFLPCMPRGYDWGSPFRFVPTRSNVLFVGVVPEKVAEVEIRFADGGRMLVKPTRGFVLAELPADQLVEGREATMILRRDRDDNVLPPRLPVKGLRADDEPCFGPLPLSKERREPFCLWA
jgi:hypothetical protein